MTLRYRKLILLLICWLIPASEGASQSPPEVNLAVEFVDHAACAHIANSLNWYQAAGLNIQAFDSYATGMALAAAFSKGGIDAAYVCLFPAINAYANAHVPIKVVAGTHLYGYGLIVNPEKIKTVEDLSKPEIRLGCTRAGSPPAVLLHRLITRYQLDPKIVTRARRMPPPKLLLSLKMGQIDAAFMPEQFPTMGEVDGFKELINAKDLWPGMQGSVLVVRDSFLRKHPDIVDALVQITRKGIDYIHEQPENTADIVARALDVAGKKINPFKLTGSLQKLSVSPAVIHQSLTTKLENTLRVNPAMVQEMINYAAKIGYIKKPFAADEILELGYCHE